MKKINLPKDLIDFYKKNQSTLEENYPGFNQVVLLRFIDDLGLERYQAEKESIEAKLLRAVPLEYITNKKFFYDCDLFVNEKVLIPRYETEILVDEAIKFAKSNRIRNFIDIGTGSGAIFINVLKALPKIETAIATDIDQNALDICKRNLAALSTSAEVHLKLADRFKGIRQKFDMILSNPPYIKEVADKNGVHFQADSYEPHLALYLKDVEYDAWFDDFFKQSVDNLNNNGLFMMEGHEDHLQNLALKLDSLRVGKVQVLKDLAGRDRFIKLIKE